MNNSPQKLNLQEVFFFLLMLLLSLAFLKLLAPFFIDIFFALILSLLFGKVNKRFEKRFRGKKSVAAISTLVITSLVFLIPITFIGIMVTKEISHTYDLLIANWSNLQNQSSQFLSPQKLQELPLIGGYIENLNWEQMRERLNDFISNSTQFLLELLQETFMNAGYMFVHVFIILFLMYYLLIDGADLEKRIHYLIPLDDNDEKILFKKIRNVTEALLINTFIIGFIEGTYGAILFTILGISSPFFWGVLMVLLSIIPLVGANSILMPMAIAQFILGNHLTGIIILVFGVGVILINQNIIRPRLDGNKSGMHPAIVFLASMGGLIWMGIIGFLVGPIITGLVLVVWDQYGQKYKTKLEQYNNNPNK